MGEAAFAQVEEIESYTLSRLCEEVSEVINRVRVAFDLVPMWEVSERPEIEEAERTVDTEARRLQQGEGDPGAWRRALSVYESVWMAALGELRSVEQARKCA